MSFLHPINFVHAQEVTSLTHIAVLAIAGLIVALILTPVYTRLAFRYKLWKQPRDTTITGEIAAIYHKLHADKHKRNIPTMGGVVTIIAIAIVTLLLNLSRNQTWLPLFVLVAAGLVGVLDDWLNIRSEGLGIAGLRGRIKFSLILAIAVLGALYFYYKLNYHLIHIPAVGNFSIGWLYIPLFILVVVSTANAVNITDGLDGLSGVLCRQPLPSMPSSVTSKATMVWQDSAPPSSEPSLPLPGLISTRPVSS